MKLTRQWSFLAALILMIFTLGAPLAAQDTGGTPIRVGSKSFPENAILGQIILITLQEAGFDVEDMTNLGDTTANRLALLNAQIDVYPEYTGTAYTNFYRDLTWFGYDEAIASNQYATHAQVSMVDAVMFDFVWLTPAPANNTFVIAVKREFAEASGLRTMTDFARYVNDGGIVRFVTDETFAQRPDGLAAFETVYSFDLTGGQMIVISGIDSTITQEALRDGVNGINAAVAFGTDGTLQAFDLVALEDDLGALPVYQPAPVFRGEVIRQHPEIAALLRPIFARLDNLTLQQLNARVQIGGEQAADVAREFLRLNNFIEGEL